MDDLAIRKKVSSRDSPDFKGIKTGLKDSEREMVESRDSPDFKGIKTYREEVVFRDLFVPGQP